MNKLFENQPIIFKNIFYEYLYTSKQLIKFYTCNRILLLYLHEIDLTKIYYTPKTNNRLRIAVIYMYQYPITGIKQYGHISTWNTSKIISMRKIFSQLVNFTSDISDWNTINVKNMDDMLNGVISENININNWNLDKVIHMKNIFGAHINRNKQLELFNPNIKEKYDELYLTKKNRNKEHIFVIINIIICYIFYIICLK